MFRINILTIFLFLLFSACSEHGKTNDEILKNRSEFIDSTISIDDNNVPIDSNQLYFPLAFFPKVKFVHEYEDSSTILISKFYEAYTSSPDTFYTYSKIIPNEFDTSGVSWYSKFLYALGEPLLFNRRFDKEIYRFLWLSTFDKPVVIRIEKTRDLFLLFGKTSSGAGGYSPGVLDNFEQMNISEEVWIKFLNLLNNINYWNLKNNGKPIDPDGSTLILEGATPDKYQVLKCYNPSRGNKIYQACNYFIELSGLNNKEKDKY